ncbi:hypothetical protein [cyanobacterium endosymbiont of Epithemia turgida]
MKNINVKALSKLVNKGISVIVQP